MLCVDALLLVHGLQKRNTSDLDWLVLNIEGTTHCGRGQDWESWPYSVLAV